MGEVWLGEQQSLGTRVAIKTLLDVFPPESEDIQRFFNEARAVSRIQHAGITKIFDSGILPNGRAYLVMEYLDGESLAQRIGRGAVSRAALADIGRQIASVLDATHSAGITHRDLKPENVFLIADREQPRGERVKVLDFGVAKLTGTLAPGSPRTYGTLGTPMYMAPEQWGDASQVDWRADLYSLGCVTFEMACRRPPFLVKSVAEACAKHLNDTPVLASSLVEGIPPALDKLIAQLLAKQPEQRPRSMRDVERAFETIGRTIGVDGTAETLPIGSLPPNADVLATVTAGQASGHPPQTQPARRRTALVVAIGASVVGAAAVTAVYLAMPTHAAPAIVEPTARPVVTTIVVDAAIAPSSHDQTLAALVQAANTGDPDPKPPTEQAAHHRAKGRDLEAKGNHAEAIVAYEQYLKAAPDDAVANAELGFAALQAKDLAKAEAATRNAITHAPKGAYLHDPNGRARGAALYNLGLIQEAQGKPKDAAAAYKESQASRPSRVVREKLQKLDPVVAATADPLVPMRLAGPFKDIRELCRAWLKKVGEDEDSTWGEGGSCAKPDAIKVASHKLAKPFLELQAFQLESRSALELAIRLDDGWYHFEYEGKGDRSSAHCGGTTFAVKQLPLAATAPQLRIEYTSSAKDCEHGGNGHSHTWGWTEKGIIAIGVGLAGKPLAPPAIVTSLDEWQLYDTEKKQQMTDAAVTLEWGKDGSLDVTGKVTHPPAIQAAIEDGDLDGEQLLGHHVLLFP